MLLSITDKHKTCGIVGELIKLIIYVIYDLSLNLYNEKYFN